MGERDLMVAKLMPPSTRLLTLCQHDRAPLDALT